MKKSMDKYFKNANKQSKRKEGEIYTDLNISDEVHKFYGDISKEFFDFDKVKASNGIIEPYDLSVHISTLITKIEAETKLIVSKYPKYYWKFITTALPKDIYSGELPTTWAFAVKMMESAISFSSQEVDVSELYKGIEFQSTKSVLINIDDSFILDYCYLIALSRTICDMYVTIRFASKGCNFKFISKNVTPEIIGDIDIESSVHLYDQRNVIEARVSSSRYLPTKSGFSLKQKHIGKIGQYLIVANDNPNPKMDFVPKYANKLKKTRLTEINYNIMPFNLHTISKDFKVKNTDFPWKIELLEIICILDFVSKIIANGWVFLPDIAMKGYILISKSFVSEHFPPFVESCKSYQKDIFNRTFELSSNDLIEKYKQPISEQIYPSNASLLFDAGKMLGFDLSNSLDLLLKHLQYTKSQGEIANLRGDFFESQTQEIIDLTRYKPKNEVRALVGKQLKSNGKFITDIDSIFIVEDVLIAISCKSMPITEEYDRGDYVSIRNTTSNLSKYILEWKDKIEYINKNKVGDNYDLSSFTNVYGVVVTPNVLYLDHEKLHQLPIDGLFNYMSVLEMESWLNKT
ncbi:hypothetical protein [Vibrio owensii]|uniref:hypothetical protein n=1 Tax=Vibrio owensii TaxID=696485 RepID=UPI0018F1375C|nr:hypothetical protein [Vibrio owensii]